LHPTPPYRRSPVFPYTTLFRSAIARALMMEPSVLLADEPTGNLDSQTSGEVMALFGLFHERGQTIVLVTHDAKVASLADRVLFIDRKSTRLNSSHVAISYAVFC